MTKTTIFSFIIIFFLSAFLRIIWIGDIPNGLNWDETAYAYNAYSFFSTGKDEWGTSHPMYLRSFDDYKPALLSYLLVPFFFITQQGNIIVRLVPALLGIGSIMFFWGFMQRISNNQKLNLIISLLISIAPWHIHFSRAALDPIVAFFFLTVGLFTLTSKKIFAQIISASAFSLSMYTYNSSRFFVPMVIFIFAAIFFHDKLLNKIKERSIFILLTTVLGGIILLQTFLGPAGTRAKMLLITNEPYIAVETNKSYDSCVKNQLPFCKIISNRRLIIAREITKHYLYHFQTDFLFFDNNKPILAFLNYGNLLIINLPFLLIGLATWHKYSKKLTLFFLLWLLIAPIPAAFTNEIPHAGRTLIVLPAFAYFIALGICSVINWIKLPKYQHLITYTILFLYGINVTFYLKDYYLLYRQVSQKEWQGYFQEVIPYVLNQQTKYDSIYFANDYANPYIFFAWYGKINPKTIQEDQSRLSISNIYFLPQKNINDLLLQQHMSNILVISINKMSDLQQITRFQSLDNSQPETTWFYAYETKSL